MADSKRALITDGLAERLRKITTANGYGTNVKKVFIDDIPMGLDFDEFEMPAILVISGDDKAEMKHQCMYGSWHHELQLWHNRVSDAVMNEFVRDVYKAIYADSPTLQRNTAFKSIHPSIYDVKPLPILSDLNMIETNRCYIVNLSIEYTAKLWDL